MVSVTALQYILHSALRCDASILLYLEYLFRSPLPPCSAQLVFAVVSARDRGQACGEIEPTVQLSPHYEALPNRNPRGTVNNYDASDSTGDTTSSSSIPRSSRGSGSSGGSCGGTDTEDA